MGHCVGWIALGHLLVLVKILLGFTDSDIYIYIFLSFDKKCEM